MQRIANFYESEKSESRILNLYLTIFYLKHNELYPAPLRKVQDAVLNIINAHVSLLTIFY